MRSAKVIFIFFVFFLAAAFISKRAELDNFVQFTNRGEQALHEETQNSTQESQTKTAASTKELPSIVKAPEPKPLEVERKVSTPPPLRTDAEQESSPPPSAGLTRSGIILATNLQRQENSLGFLREDGTLDAMASAKANDMCAKQYFAHTSPSGVGAAELADSFGYDYIAVGENLALGPFASDAAVVEAWMGSPGHRANILNSRFTEIGVGVTKCVFEGRPTWLAVQHFGKPTSDCRQADATLKNKINSDKAALESLSSKLANLKNEIETSDSETNPDYYSKINEYDSLAEQYNSLLSEARGIIKQYNAQVEAFNQCASG